MKGPRTSFEISLNPYHAGISKALNYNGYCIQVQATKNIPIDFRDTKGDPNRVKTQSWSINGLYRAIKWDPIVHKTFTNIARVALNG